MKRAVTLTLALTALASIGVACSSAPVDSSGAADDAISVPRGPILPVLAWKNGWDNPVAGSTEYDLSAFFDGTDPHLAMLIRQGEVLHRYFHNGSWHDDYLGVTTAGPSQFLGVAAARDTTTGAFYVVASKPQWHTFMRTGTNGAWNSDWIDLGGLTLYKPAIASASGWANVFVVGTDSNLYHRMGTGTGNWTSNWDELTLLPGGRTIIAAPAVTVRAGLSSYDLVAAANDHTLWHMSFMPYGKGTWDQIPVVTPVHGDVGIASMSANNLEVGALGEDNLVHQYSWDGTRWLHVGLIAPCSPENIGTNSSRSIYPTPIALASKGDGTADVYMDGIGGSLSHNQFAMGNNLTAPGASLCGTCNLPGNACCPSTGYGNFCHNGLTCDGTNHCAAPACGTLGAQICPTGQPCQKGGTDDGTGWCVACGAKYQRCCLSESPPCQSGACTDEGALYGWWCEDCGTIGKQGCDTAPQCTQARSTFDPGSRLCTHCGDHNELPCNDSTRCYFSPYAFDSLGHCSDPVKGPPPPPPPPQDAPNCGLAQTGLAAPCCTRKTPCESNWVCKPSSDKKNYCYPPTSSAGSACGSGSPQVVSICVTDEWGANLYTNEWCSASDATNFFQQYCDNIKGEYGLTNCEVGQPGQPCH